MAARVVWLVANGYARPGEVLGLTFTRKAAGQLLRRVRTRLARLAGAGLVPGDGADVDEHPAIGTYHAFAGTLLREHGLLLPVEPSTRLIGETELWQLAFRVVCEHPGRAATPRSRRPPITAMVLRLAGQLAEHLVDTDQLRDTHARTGAAGAHPARRARGSATPGPTRRCSKLLATQTERTELVPLIDALHAADARRERDGLRHADGGGGAARRDVPAGRASSCASATGWCCSTSTRTPVTRSGSRCRRCSAAASTTSLALTAVGDPIQSIYGWRGASATNLPRFTTDFCLSDGTPGADAGAAHQLAQPAERLHLANAVSAEARRRSVAVRELLPRPGAQPGTVRCALLTDVGDRKGLGGRPVGAASTTRPSTRERTFPTTAVLVRRNADAAPIADALTARGVPVEVVGLAGLLAVPEVADVVAMLRLAADPTAGSAAMRVLTGPRWRLGAADVDRAVAAGGGARPAPGDRRPVVGDAHRRLRRPRRRRARVWPTRSAIRAARTATRRRAIGRIVALCRELTALRAQLHHPLPDLVAEVRWMLGVDAEVRAAQPVSAGWGGTEHLDAFADVVADFAARPSATVAGLLAFLDAAMDVENGLAPAEITVAKDRVQILTVHAAKGLEWQVVAVPHLSGRVFPSTASRAHLADRRRRPAAAAARRPGRRCPSTACRCSTRPT